MNGFKQTDVVARLELLGSSISRTSYVKIENGYRNIKISDLVALKNIFGVDYAEFFKDIPTSRPSKQKQN